MGNIFRLFIFVVCFLSILLHLRAVLDMVSYSERIQKNSGGTNNLRSTGKQRKMFRVDYFNSDQPSNMKVDWPSMLNGINPARSKVLLLVRHGQALHNLGPSLYGEKRWLAVEGLSENYFDAPLTEKGKGQAKNASDLIVSTMVS